MNYTISARLVVHKKRASAHPDRGSPTNNTSETTKTNPNNTNEHTTMKTQQRKKIDLRLRLCLPETKAAAAFFPLAALLQQIDTLETLQYIALRRDLTRTSQTWMLTHLLLLLLKKQRALYHIQVTNASGNFRMTECRRMARTGKNMQGY